MSAHQAVFPIATMARVLGVSKAGYYAWLRRSPSARVGLTPSQHSTGGKQKLGATSKMGERTLRRLLIIGASSVVRRAIRHGTPSEAWLGRMLARRRFDSQAEARMAVFRFIEGWYNPARRHSGLGYLSPIAYEEMMQAEP